MPTHPGGDCRWVMESSASPVLTRPTNSLARLGMLPTQAMMVGEAINLGITSSWKTNSTRVSRGAPRGRGRVQQLGSDPGTRGSRGSLLRVALTGPWKLAWRVSSVRGNPVREGDRLHDNKENYEI